ncbi:MAG: hypothetical protein IPL61_21835 [Myxococcales bacterium]|nr:hypothetical protein [Myxococcales bacterium]
MSLITATRDVQLVPVLEVEPWRLSDRPLPADGPARAHAAAWDAHFRECVADAGFEAVALIAPGAHFVRARDLTGHPLLDRLIAERLADTGLPNFPDPDGPDDCPPIERVGALAGGYALVVDDIPVHLPGCCGDLGDLDEWSAALAERPRDDLLWIGHPMLRIEFVGDRVTLTERDDDPMLHLGLDRRSVTLPTAWLGTAIVAARVEHARVRADVTDVVARLIGDAALAAEVALALVK